MTTAQSPTPGPVGTAPALPMARQRDRRGLAVAIAVVLLGAGFILLAESAFNAYRLQLVTLVLIYAIVAVALAVTSGFTGVFSLGQIGFLAIGAYVSSLMTIPPIWKDEITLADLPAWLATLDMSGLNPHLALFLACLAGGLVAAFVALLVGGALMRLSGNYVAVATMGFLIIVYTLAVNASGFTAGSRGLSQIPGYVTAWTVYIWAVVTIYAAWRLRHSPYGRAMIASRENLLAARGAGVNVWRSRLLAFVFGAFFTGVAGALLAHQVGAIAPSQFYFQTTFIVITMVVLGGMGSITGAVVGAAIMTVLPEYLRAIDGGVQIGSWQSGELYGISQIILAVGFILVMIFRPQGIFGNRELSLGLFSRRALNQEPAGEDIALTPELAPGVSDPPPDARA